MKKFANVYLTVTDWESALNPAHAYDTLFSAKYCKRGLFRLIGGSHYETTIQYRTLYASEP